MRAPRVNKKMHQDNGSYIALIHVNIIPPIQGMCRLASWREKNLGFRDVLECICWLFRLQMLQ